MPIRAPEPDTVIRGTTILCVRNAGHVVVAGDGQVSVGQTIMKHGARKVRRLHDDKVLAGFAGSTADAFTLQQTQITRRTRDTASYVGPVIRWEPRWKTPACMAS